MFWLDTLQGSRRCKLFAVVYSLVWRRRALSSDFLCDLELRAVDQETNKKDAFGNYVQWSLACWIKRLVQTDSAVPQKYPTAKTAGAANGKAPAIWLLCLHQLQSRFQAPKSWLGTSVVRGGRRVIGKPGSSMAEVPKQFCLVQPKDGRRRALQLFALVKSQRPSGGNEHRSLWKGKPVWNGVAWVVARQ